MFFFKVDHCFIWVCYKITLKTVAIFEKVQLFELYLFRFAHNEKQRINKIFDNVDVVVAHNQTTNSASRLVANIIFY